MYYVNVSTLLLNRLRGAANLRQSLPHFGNDDVTEEIEDFIKMCSRDPERNFNASATNLRRSVNRRMSATVNFKDLGGNQSTSTTTTNRRRSFSRRINLATSIRDDEDEENDINCD